MTQPRLANDGIAICHSLKEMSDEWLVAAAKNGDVTAFAQLRDRHFRSIMRTTYRITRNWEDAEDALQDTFLKAFIHLNRFECRSSFFSWVTRIAINASLATLRKKRASKNISIDACDNDGASGGRWEMPDLREDPERCYSRREREDSLRRAIRRLRPNLRTALEYSTQEIADSLGISSAAAKSRLLRARLSLRAQLRNDSLPSYQSENARSID